ncbi:MAG: mandelate racemase/muconate lactonizing enzyme family protein [Bryobacteraceae bacterium]|nr:mandelate racemase/muconate lactonizing enzyme family protein [Bryobacteraceae bacterium]MDW8376533.1 mandelate racemase/muconate lactonizing enzyme family protein [Bryobacterales bacterium]
MKITGYRVWLVEGVKYNWTLLKLYAEDGVSGIGEATNWPGSPMVEAAVEHVARYIIGQDSRQIDFLWTKLYRDFHWLGQGGPLLSAISAVDIALWDMFGKRCGLPVYQLLGGAYRKEIPLYANYWFLEGDGSVEDYQKQARAMASLGFQACKLDPFQHTSYLYGEHLAPNLALSEERKRLAIERLRAVQQAVGPDFPIAVETHALLNEADAVELAHRIHAAGIRCLWYEEPAGPEFPDSLARIRRSIPLPVCAGERVHSRYQALTLLQKQAVDFLMPDITRCGGISEMRKIASLAEAFNLFVAPHNPNGPVSTIASAHVMASIPNFLLQEFIVQDVEWRDRILSRPLPVRAGRYYLDDSPGLGFELNEQELSRWPGVREKRDGFYV